MSVVAHAPAGFACRHFRGGSQGPSQSPCLRGRGHAPHRSVRRVRGFGIALAAVLAASVSSLACVGSPLPAQRRYQRKVAQARLAQFESPGLVIGEFALAANAVVDGDTIRVEGLGNSLRLVCVDTEETFKREPERRAFEEGWQTYLETMRGKSPRPVKMATPLGEDAKKFAKQFFADVTEVRLERDHPKEIRDFYTRYLSYVFAKKNGAWVNYNLEAVRAGMSPYYTKYGYSRRFHAEFVAAQREAQQAKRGIWDPTRLHYPDYDERLTWWNARADFARKFEAEAQDRDRYITLTHWDSMAQLEKLEGQEVVLIGVVEEIRLGDRGPTKVLLSRRRTASFPIVFFDKDVFLSSGVANFKGEYIRVRGVVNRYHDKRRNRDQLQIIVNLPGQIIGPDKEAAVPAEPTTTEPTTTEPAASQAAAAPR